MIVLRGETRGESAHKQVHGLVRKPASQLLLPPAGRAHHGQGGGQTSVLICSTFDQIIHTKVSV